MFYIVTLRQLKYFFHYCNVKICYFDCNVVCCTYLNLSSKYICTEKITIAVMRIKYQSRIKFESKTSVNENIEVKFNNYTIK